MKCIKQYKWTLLAGLLIIIAVLMPGSDVPSVGIPHMDKVVHFGMFAILTLSFYWEYTRLYKKFPAYYKTWGALEVFALLTELMQLFAEGRSCDMKDFIADSLGIILSMMLFIFWLEKRRTSRH